jgi:hypothetical protein
MIAAMLAAPIALVGSAIILGKAEKPARTSLEGSRPLIPTPTSPAKAATMTRSMREWLRGHARMLDILVGLAFGLIFLWKGLGVLVGQRRNAQARGEGSGMLSSGRSDFWSRM